MRGGSRAWWWWRGGEFGGVGRLWGWEGEVARGGEWRDECERGSGEAAELGIAEDFDGFDVCWGAELRDGQVGEGVGYGLEFDCCG